jgi:hypothetical protein
LSQQSLSVSVIGFVWNEFRGPEIEASSYEVSNPFVTHFSLKNPHLIVPIKNLNASCVIKRLDFGDGNYIAGDSYEYPNMREILAAGKTVQYACAGSPPPVSSLVLRYVEIEIAVRFTVLKLFRDPEAETFTWTPEDKRWLKGRRLN